MGEETIKKGILTTGRARNMEKRTNKELRELYTDLHIVANIKKKRLEWIGHVVRMNQGRTVKKIYESKLEGVQRGCEVPYPISINQSNWREVEEGEDLD